MITWKIIRDNSYVMFIIKIPIMAPKIILDNFRFREARCLDCLPFKLSGNRRLEILLESFNYWCCHEASGNPIHCLFWLSLGSHIALQCWEHERGVERRWSSRKPLETRLTLFPHWRSNFDFNNAVKCFQTALGFNSPRHHFCAAWLLESKFNREPELNKLRHRACSVFEWQLQLCNFGKVQVIIHYVNGNRSVLEIARNAIPLHLSNASLSGAVSGKIFSGNCQVLGNTQCSQYRESVMV